MREKEFAELTSDYLRQLATLTSVPHLITRYRCDAQTISEKYKLFPSARACPKCLLQPYETYLQTSIKPQASSKILHKYSKNNKTKYQIKKAKQQGRVRQQLVVKCSTCKHIATRPLQKPQKEPKETKIIILDTPIKKKKKKSKTSGINADIVAQVQQETRIVTTAEVVDLITPKKTKKRKHEEVIVITDSPVTPKKSKKNQENLLMEKNNNKPSKKDLKAMKQQAQDVEDARKSLDPLTTKKEKKKLKHKLRKLKDSIKNIEVNNDKSKKSTLQSFLNTLSV